MFYEAVLALCTVILTLESLYFKRIIQLINQRNATKTANYHVTVFGSIALVMITQFSLFSWVISLYAIFNGGKYDS